MIMAKSGHTCHKQQRGVSSEAAKDGRSRLKNAFGTLNRTFVARAEANEQIRKGVQNFGPLARVGCSNPSAYWPSAACRGDDLHLVQDLLDRRAQLCEAVEHEVVPELDFKCTLGWLVCTATSRLHALQGIPANLLKARV